MKIIDNFLEKNDLDYINNELNSYYFPWYSNDVVNQNLFYANNNKYNNQFTHIFYDSHFAISNFINIINPLIDKINPISFIRIKANLIPCTETIIEHGFHTDFDFKNLKTAIWYLNTNNGYTLFENGEKIQSISNRFVEFDSSIKHTGSSTSDAKSRIVINFNYFPKESNDII